MAMYRRLRVLRAWTRRSSLWRRKAPSSGAVAPLTEGPSKPDKFTRFEAVDSSVVEIVVGDVVVRTGGGVDPDHLANVLRAVRKA